MTHGSHSKEQTDSSDLSDWRESVTIIKATSFLANKRPLSENLLKKHHQRMQQKNKKYYHDGGTVTKRNVNNLDLLTKAIHTCELNCLGTRKIILAFPLHQASQKVKQHPVI